MCIAVDTIQAHQLAWNPVKRKEQAPTNCNCILSVALKCLHLPMRQAHVLHDFPFCCVPCMFGAREIRSPDTSAFCQGRFKRVHPDLGFPLAPLPRSLWHVRSLQWFSNVLGVGIVLHTWNFSHGRVGRFVRQHCGVLLSVAPFG